MTNSSDRPLEAGFATDPFYSTDTKQLTALQRMLLLEDLYTAKRLVSSDITKIEAGLYQLQQFNDSARTEGLRSGNNKFGGRVLLLH